MSECPQWPVHHGVRNPLWKRKKEKPLIKTKRTKAIPLATCLRVDGNLIIVTPQLIPSLLSPIDKGVIEFRPAGNWGVYLLQSPIQRYRLAGTDFSSCVGDHSWCEEVDGAEFVLDAVFVEESPSGSWSAMGDQSRSRWQIQCREGEGGGDFYGIPVTLGISFHSGKSAAFIVNGVYKSRGWSSLALLLLLIEVLGWR